MDLNCNVLSIGHHGSATATWDFLERQFLNMLSFLAVRATAMDIQTKIPWTSCRAWESRYTERISRARLWRLVMVRILHGIKLPCNDYSPGDNDDSGTQPQQTVTTPEPTQNPSIQVVVWFGYPQQEVSIIVSQTVGI
ncbi:MAG: hypothetical protein ACLUOI_19185 [Eisenbergiella sp.]